MIIVYTLTIFLGAALIFAVQPMFARMVLPLLGGTPSVWNTCMVFFQAALLAGYGYAHLSTRWLGIRRQAVIHLLILLPPLFFLPMVVGPEWVPPGGAAPIGWLLLLLAAVVGLPFFVVSSTSPLLQRWLGATSHPSAKDPYFLYAASNAGSMLALLGYPLVIEPFFSLSAQSKLWAIGYLCFIAAMFACAVLLLRSSKSPSVSDATDAPVQDQRRVKADRQQDDSPVTARRFGRWVVLAAVPSSLLLGVTTFITTDLVVAPLLWVIPLVIYLSTFMLVFARRRLIPHQIMVRAQPIAVIALLVLLLSAATEPMPLIVLLHLLAFFVMAMVCHRELVLDRPAASSLTAFYFAMSLGGLLGGAFNGILAPLVFTGIAEYPIAIVLACLLTPSLLQKKQKKSKKGEASLRWADFAWPAGLGIGTLAIVMLGNVDSMQTGPVRIALLIGLPALLSYLLSRRPVRFGLSIGAVMLAASLETSHFGEILERERTFFGVHQVSLRDVVLDSGERAATHNLHHGTTLHGQQWVDLETRAPIRDRDPLTYYHRDGPIGHVFLALTADGALRDVGLVGLGVGALAAYAETGHSFHFFEIDPAVVRIAEDRRYFSYLGAARERGALVSTTIGDARLTLGDADSLSFDLLVIDAFSSDSIPVHLITREAIALYVDRVREGGLVALHISNRYLDLEPVLAAISEELGLVGLVNRDMSISDARSDDTGRHRSHWVVLARHEARVSTLRRGVRESSWIPLANAEGRQLWTDDYSNFIRVLKW